MLKVNYVSERIGRPDPENNPYYFTNEPVADAQVDFHDLPLDIQAVVLAYMKLGPRTTTTMCLGGMYRRLGMTGSRQDFVDAGVQECFLDAGSLEYLIVPYRDNPLAQAIVKHFEGKFDAEDQVE